MYTKFIGLNTLTNYLPFLMHQYRYPTSYMLITLLSLGTSTSCLAILMNSRLWVSGQYRNCHKTNVTIEQDFVFKDKFNREMLTRIWPKDTEKCKCLCHYTVWLVEALGSNLQSCSSQLGSILTILNSFYVCRPNTIFPLSLVNILKWNSGRAI